MLAKELATTGLRIPEIGLGTWDYYGGPEPLRRGFDAGALFVDTAESYGTEPAVADALAGRRDSVFLATKVSPGHFHHADVIRAADASLHRLRTDHLDLYQLHQPNASIPIEETMAAMETLVDAGKVRFIGVSNFSVAQLQRAQKALRKHPLVSNQVRFSLVDRTITPDLLPYCQANGITVIAYSPLARRLSRIFDGDPSGILAQVAREVGRTAVQVTLNWCLHHDRVVVIPKGNSVSHVVENCGASDWRLSPDQFRLLTEKIRFRRRGRFELFLRRHVPASLTQTLQSAVRLLPAGIRRRVH